MKVNMPVTNVEHQPREGSILVSKTDLKGVITYCNRDFIEISGFKECELIGSSHNIVRHPDMPPEAYQDLWETIKSERPWGAVVKNRCKNGDFYWVYANVTPLKEHGRVTGYMSVRTPASRDQINAAEELYQKVNEKQVPYVPSISATQEIGSGSYKLKALLTSVASVLVLLFAAIALLTVMDGSKTAIIALLLSAVVLVGLSAWALNQNLFKPLRYIKKKLHQIAEGDYFSWVEYERKDEMGELISSLKAAQIKLAFNVMGYRDQAADALRIKTALDNVSTSVMMADQDLNIIYMNKTAVQLFKHAEKDIQRDLPAFNADVLMGACIDQFHKNPEHQRALLEQLTTTYQSEFVIGGRTLRVVANPVVDETGRHLGSAVEWTDRTAEVAVEQEVDHIVNLAYGGDLSSRISLEDKGGFYKSLGEGINALINVVESAFNDVALVMSHMAKGDMTQLITNDYQGAFGSVKQDVNGTLGNLEKVIEEIREALDLISSASDEISLGNTSLSSRTEEQASALEETASSIEELTGTVRNNSENAQQANSLAVAAFESAERGGEVVSQAVTAMGEINQASKKISEIISVINDIAFQTNLLALNASVEAARAGEQGRGFAVVATEVRNLAGRSAAAAKEIKLLIEDSVEKVLAGSALVNKSGETLEEIVHSVKQVGSIVSEIAVASRQQSAGIDQVNQAVNSIDQVTQQNAALAEQTSAASEAMNQRATEIQRMMAFFKTNLQSERIALPEVNESHQQLKALKKARASSRDHMPIVPVYGGSESGDEWEEF
ncbi:MAG: methyl-accepting chemotaxis protein [Sedimenticola sp.]|nr:methyl-accepting chemotaxis protein [Sedimenticola sp.]